jgi:hypothetical protein
MMAVGSLIDIETVVALIHPGARIQRVKVYHLVKRSIHIVGLNLTDPVVPPSLY